MDPPGTNQPPLPGGESRQATSVLLSIDSIAQTVSIVSFIVCGRARVDYWQTHPSSHCVVVVERVVNVRLAVGLVGRDR